MIGYKIKYGEYGYDCWGKSEWCGWYEYDNIVYTNKDSADKALLEAEQKYHDREFKLYEVELK